MVCLRYEANKMIENFTIHAKCAAGYKGVHSAEMRGKVDFEMTVFLFLVLNQLQYILVVDQKHLFRGQWVVGQFLGAFQRKYS